MAYVIAEPCIGMKDTACVDVCPCDCIHPTKDEREFAASPQLYINPDDCVDCGRASRLPGLGDLSSRASPRKMGTIRTSE